MQELASRPLSLLFRVETIATIVSPSLTVRSTANAIGLANRVRRVKLGVRGFKPTELESARRWCEAQRSAATARQAAGYRQTHLPEAKQVS